MNDLIIFWRGSYAQPAEKEENPRFVSVWLFPLGVMGQLVITTEREEITCRERYD